MTVKILFLSANPKVTPQLRLNDEIRLIKESLREADNRDLFDLESEWSLRVEEVHRALLRYKPHIVHFSGHGSKDGEIILETDSGKFQTVSAVALSAMFRILKANIRCVVLNACYSEVQAKGIVEHIDCVVGMSEKVSDTAAQKFAGSFYNTLGYGESAQTAFELACVTIQSYDIPEEDTPRIHFRDGIDPTSVVFDGSSLPDQPPASPTPAAPDTPNILVRIVDVLQPYMSDEQERRAMVQLALDGSPVLNGITWGGNAQVFTVGLVRRLLDFGQVRPGVPAIVAVLQVFRDSHLVGGDKDAAFNVLIEELTP